MKVLRFDDPGAFAERTRAFLLEHEAENCFFLGHIPTLENPTDVLLACVVDATDTVAGVALMTPGRHMVMTRAPTGAVLALTKFLHDQRIAPPGIQGPREVTDTFAREWERLTGKPGHSPVGMAVHQLARVIPPARPAIGKMRDATAADLDLVTQWITDFRRDIGESQLTDNREMAERRIATGEIALWENGGELVAMAGATGQTPSGVRVVLVYTPARFRKRGYASTLVATLSQRLLDSGRKFCFLYTDLANPTSNKIYREIGYLPIGESVRFLFE